MHLLFFALQEFALKACIEHFNSTYYNLEGGASVSGTTPPSGQVGAGGIGQQQQQAAGTPSAGLNKKFYRMELYNFTIFFSGLAGVGVGPTTASPGGGVATTATAQPTSTTATPSGSGQGTTGKETFEPLELNYLELLGQEVY